MRANAVKRKRRITILVIGILFAITTALGLHFFAPLVTHAADPWANLGTLRFRQVEAGEDFAIAVTFEGHLYGWSLLPTRAAARDFANVSWYQTLGEKYPGIPTRINVDFFNGIGTNTTVPQITPDAYVRTVATSRRHAALVASNGRVFTWGPSGSIFTSIVSPQAGLDGAIGDSEHGGSRILMRDGELGSAGSGHNDTRRPYHVPGIVNISVMNNLHLDYFPISGVTGTFANATAIVGGENNFVVTIPAGSFGWGSDLFGQISQSTVTRGAGSGGALTSIPTGDGLGLLAGIGSNIAIGDDFILTTVGNQLHMRGKNFYLAQGQHSRPVAGTNIGDGLEMVPLQAPITPNRRNVQITLNPHDNTHSPTNSALYTIENGAVQSFQQINTGVRTFGNSAVAFHDGREGGTITSPLPNGFFQLYRRQTAASSGFLYFISVGNLYMMGNNIAGQAGFEAASAANSHVSSPQHISAVTGTVVEVAAGRPGHNDNAVRRGRFSGTAFGEEITGAASRFIFSHSSASAIAPINMGYILYSSDVINFNNHRADFASTTAYISAALNSAGTVFAWNVNRTPTEVRVGAVPLSTFLRGREQVTSISGGYGNNLFALTNLGRMFHITCTGSEIGDFFSAILINEFQSAANTPMGFNHAGVWGLTGANTNYLWAAENRAVANRRMVFFADASNPGDTATIGINEVERSTSGTTTMPTGTADGYTLPGFAGVVPRVAVGTPLNRDTERGNLSSTIVRNMNVFDTDLSADSSFVAADISGSPFRILLDGTGDRADLFATATMASYFAGTNSDTASNIPGAPNNADIVFTRGGLPNEGTGSTVLSLETVNRYFDFDIIVDSNFANDGTRNFSDDISFRITPIRSTAGSPITVSFTIGRFDCVRNNGERVVYEYRTVSFDVWIGFAPVATPNIFGVDSLPLLDTNPNASNHSYSIAAMNVNAGFETLSRAVSERGAQGGNYALVDLIHTQLYTADSGFPHVDRFNEISHLGSRQAGFFQSEYRYFGSSLDGNLLWINQAPMVVRGNVGAPLVVSAIPRMINLSIDLRVLFGGAPNDDWIDEIRDFLNNEFDNRYGFFDLPQHVVNPNDTTQVVNLANLPSSVSINANGILSIAYQVLTISALQASDTAHTVPSETDDYTSVEAFPTTGPWRSPETVYQGSGIGNRPHVLPSFVEYRIALSGTNSRAQEPFRFSPRLDGNPATHNTVVVHTHTALRLQGGRVNTGSGFANSRDSVTAQLGDNEAVYIPRTTVTVGNNLSYTILLSEILGAGLAGRHGNLETVFTMNNGGNPDAAVNANGQFPGFIGLFQAAAICSDRTYLRHDRINVFFTEEGEAEFTVGVLRRFWQHGQVFRHTDNSTAEFILLRIRLVSQVVSFNLTSPYTQHGLTRKIITDGDSVSARTINIREWLSAADNNQPWANYLEIRNIGSIQSRQFVTFCDESSNSNQEIVLIPHASGLMTVYFEVHLFNRMQRVTVEVEVRSISDFIDGAMRIANIEQIHFSDMRTVLARDNPHVRNIHTIAANLEINTATDGTGGDSGVWDGDRVVFPDMGATTTMAGLTLQQWEDGAWRTRRLDQFSFLRSIDLRMHARDQFLRIQMGSVLPEEMESILHSPPRVLVHFIHADTRLTVAIPFVPAHMDLRTNLAGTEEGDLVFSIDYHAAGVDFGLDTNGLHTNNQPRHDRVNSSLILTRDFFLEILPMAEVGQFTISGVFSSDDYFNRPEDADRFLEASIRNRGISNPNEHIEFSFNGRLPTTAMNVNLEDRIDAIRFTVMFSHREADLQHENFQVSFFVRVYNIRVTLTTREYLLAFLWMGLAVFGLLFIIFLIRFIIYSRKKAEQKRIIKKNKTLIGMRDKMHGNKSVDQTAALKAKLRMNDPKYAKMFNEMRKDKEAETGITLDNSKVAKNAEGKSKTMDRVQAAKSKKKGKKSIDELKAELAAKREAIAQAQAGVGVVQPITGGATQMPLDSNGDMMMDQSIISGAPVFGSNNEFEVQDAFQAYNPDLTAQAVDEQIQAKLEENAFVFEPVTDDGGF